ncbi:MAG: hypothetical protein K6T83_22285 [Alicyclobacillus sp.]|nr:hypothetical protein [Alicyclobacillus sp.]
MTWQKEDEELFQRLREFPTIPMNLQSQQRILKELIQMEQALERQRRVSMRQAFSAMFAGAAGVAIVAAGIMGYNHFGPKPSSGALPGNVNSPASTAKPTYFGYQLPFQPMLPAKVAPGYHLDASEVNFTYHNGKRHFADYVASYVKGNTAAMWGANVPRINIYEVPGTSIKQNNAGLMDASIDWNQTVRVHGHTYYLSHTFGHIVGVVKDGVVYAINGGNLSYNTLLEYAENLSRVAPIEVVCQSAAGYKDATANVSFRPLMPRGLSSTYKLKSIVSNVLKSKSGTTQSVELVYQMKTKPGKSFSAIEGPLHNANQFYVFPSNVSGYAPTWKDHQRGLEIQLEGNTSSSEFHRVLRLFQSAS